MNNETINQLARESIRIAIENIQNQGGPFSSIIVKDGEIIAKGSNRVTHNNDPTAHAEVVAIREACQKLNTYQLEDCILIASCEPCPMCLGAAYWARVKAVYYIASKEDAAKAGFDDSFIYKEINLPQEKRSIPFIKVDIEEYNQPFNYWETFENKKRY